jgi:predicted Fe-Mo cluster-binding NifX family protein
MKIAIPANEPDLSARCSDRLGLAPYLIIVDAQSGHWEAFANPDQTHVGSGMTMVAQIIANHCQVLLAQWCSPIAEKYLSNAGVQIVTGLGSRTVTEAIVEFQSKSYRNSMARPHDLRRRIANRGTIILALDKAFRQIYALLPVMLGVVMLLGIFNALIPKRFLFGLFPGHGWQDAFRGALVGSFFAGNPVNSYIAGAQMLNNGMSIGAVTAFMCAWVMVGLVQLPAEASALGWRFAAARNAGCFVLSMVIGWIIAFWF